MNISNKSNKNGFTFIEIIIVIVIIGIIAVIAIPNFVNLQNEARQKAEQTTVTAVRSGISNYYQQSVIHGRTPRYPPTLDDASDGLVSSSNQFFTNVLSMSIISDWQKSGFLYTGPAGATYTYDPITGLFESGGLLYGWSMNEGSGGTVGQGSYQGDLEGNTQWVAGKVGTALNFNTGPDGLGAYVSVPDSDNLDLTTAGTVGAWIYADSLTPNQGAGIIHKGDATDFSDEAYSLQFWTGNTIALLVNDKPNSYTLIQSKVDITPNQWHYVVGTWDQTGMRIYIDGELNNSNTAKIAAQNSSGSLNIGAQLSQQCTGSWNDAFFKNLPFKGTIDEAHIYDKALSADEIKTYYNSTK